MSELNAFERQVLQAGLQFWYDANGALDIKICLGLVTKGLMERRESDVEGVCYVTTPAGAAAIGEPWAEPEPPRHNTPVDEPPQFPRAPDGQPS